MSSHAAARVAVLGLLVVLVALPSLACRSHPRVMVESLPPGAEVTLQLVYEREKRTHVLIVSHSQFEDPEVTEPIPLGRTPVRYSFPQSETESYVGVSRVNHRVRRHYIEGVLWIEKEGYEPKEVTFPVKRGTTRIEVDLVPAR